MRCSLHGFTLIEVIVSIIILGLIAALIIPVMGTSVLQSSVPLLRVEDSLSARSTLERMTAAHVNKTNNAPEESLAYLCVLGAGDPTVEARDLDFDTTVRPVAGVIGGNCTGNKDHLLVLLRDRDGNILFSSVFSRARRSALQPLLPPLRLVPAP